MSNNSNDKWYWVKYFDGKCEIKQGRPKMGYEGGPACSLSAGYSTREELCEKSGIPEKPCKYCGNPFTTTFFEPTKSILLNNNICFDCNHWESKIESAQNDPKIVVINGTFYSIGPKNNLPSSLKGHGGRKFLIRRFDNVDNLIETDNLWCGGDISAIWRDKFPDTGEFVKIPSPIGHGQGYLG